MTRFTLIAALLLSACATDEEISATDDDMPASVDGKADGSGVEIEWCKEAAGDYARKLYNDFKDFEILETTVATVLEQKPTWMWIQTDSEGHGSESTDVILMSSACYPIGSKWAIPDRGAAVFFARKAAAAAKAHVLATWDFDRIVSAELRWPVTSKGVTVDVVVLDGGHDEGSFAVSLTSSGKVKSLVQTQSFTP